MKYLLILLSCVFCLHQNTALACDACSMYEFSPLQAKSFVGVFYNYSFFNGYKTLSQPFRFTFNPNNLRGGSNLHIGHVDPTVPENETITPSKKDFEMYQTIDLRFNYNLKNKWNFILNLPFEMNTVYFQDVRLWEDKHDTLYQQKAFGDVLLAAEKVSMIKGDKFQHVFKYGGGVFVPTGNLELKNDDGELNHTSHYTGRGNFEAIARASYSVKVNNTYGAMLLGSQAFGTTTKDGDLSYSFGKRTNVQENFFYTFSLKEEIQLIPMLGAYYESIANDKVNDVALESTSSKSVFGNISTGLKYKEVLLRIEYQLPIWQKTVAYQLQNSGRLNVMAIYNL